MENQLDDVGELLEKVSDYANSLGLHGVLILSPKCKDCGQLHEFEMVSDLSQGSPAHGFDTDDLVGLLTKFAGIAENKEPSAVLEKPLGGNHKH